MLSTEIENYRQEIEEQTARVKNLNQVISRKNEENSHLRAQLESLGNRIRKIEIKVCRLQEKRTNAPTGRKFSLKEYLKKLIMGKK
jgi:predicted  nucleic acid-binding Zn-ribbon protein